MMKKFTHNCNDIKRYSKKDTHNIFIRYKTPILEGAIKIINEFKKDKEDGVHYKNLCEELNKYAKVQRRCFREEITNQGYTYKSQEWNKIVNALYITFNSNSIKRLCYLEKDKEETTKKYVLDIHEAFRDFCIEKKPKETNSTLSFEECMQYLEWIKMKKDMILAMDPGYAYISNYSEFFDIRKKCNYPWLIDNKPDMICVMNTKTKPKDQDDKAKTSVDTSQSTPDIARATPAGDTKVNPDSAQPPSTGVVVPLDGKRTSTHQEKTPIQRNSSDTEDTNKQSSLPSTDVQGNPIPMTIPVFQPINFSEHPQFKDFIKTLPTNFDGQKISHVHQPFKQNPIIIPNDGASNVRGEPIKPIITRSYNYVPVKFSRKQRKFPKHLTIKPFSKFIPRSKIFPEIIPYSMQYLDKILPRKNYSDKYISMKSSVPIFLRINPNYENTPGNKNMDIVKIELPTPDASYFRSPLLISILAFLILSTIITTLFLLFKYTSFGWIFGKKKKKKRLKRQLEIKKITEKSSTFDNISNYSVNDMPNENKTHEDNNIYSKIKIQKGVINKNISIPKKKKNKRKAIIDIHIELLNEYKNDEWKLKKNDFLEICLEQFIIEQNKAYHNLEHNGFLKKNISTQNTKEDKVFLWDKWVQKYTPIWENFKRGNTFKILQYEWKEEENAYFDKIEEQNSSLNENEKISYIEIKKDIWRRWITKQTKL
ncbi:STP1 protein, partial [Plasmodium ovale]